MLYDNTLYTLELRDVVESGVKVWDFDYPTPAKTVTYNGKTANVPFDKDSFQQKILDHYWFRQIGQETVGRWLHYFRARIREIMPYYCQLYEFEAKWRNVDDPLESYNLRETFEQETTGTGNITGSADSTSSTTSSGTSSSTSSGTASSETSGNTSNTRKFSDTPQGSISNLDTYMSEATQETGTSSSNTNDTTSSEASGTTSDTTTATGESNNTQTSEESGSVSHTLTRRGNIGVQPLGGEVMNIRQAFINIDQMVIQDLKDLFVQIY